MNRLGRSVSMASSYFSIERIKKHDRAFVFNVVFISKRKLASFSNQFYSINHLKDKAWEREP